MSISFEEFERIFRDNIQKRSRTAKGKSSTGVSSKKKSLKLQGEALSAQVMVNTTALIVATWLNRDPKLQSAKDVRGLFEWWYDIINHKLQDVDCSGGETASRYRAWNVMYGTKEIRPPEIDAEMGAFYGSLLTKIKAVRDGELDPAELLAYADYMIDTEIHPWADGCGRHATAVVMWLALLVGSRAPVFGPREEHYRSIRDIRSHVEYMRSCINVGA